MTRRLAEVLSLLASIPWSAGVAQDPEPEEEPMRRWIRLLGSEDIETRERATSELIRLGRAALPEVEKVARDSSSPEAKTRAETILRETKFSLGVQDRARELLRRLERGQRIGRPDPAGVNGWVMKNEKGVEYPQTFLEEEAVPLVALGKHAVPELLAWVLHEEMQIRHVAGRSLERITGVEPGFPPSATLEEHAKQDWVKKDRIAWMEWYERHGQDSRMTFDSPTRAEFAAKMRRINEGVPEADVRALLGKPDDVRTQNDPGGISTTETKEMWGYGTNGHLTFPTLGQVYIDVQGKAQYVYGRGEESADLLQFKEEELRDLLRIVDKAPKYEGWRYDPREVVEIVNVLQPLGKDKALAVIDEYLRVASHFHSDAREGLFLVLRVLFEIPEDLGFMPRMIVGAPSPSEPKDPTLIPRFPIALVDDVPILLVVGYMLGGIAQPVEDHVNYFRRSGTLRAKPLSPSVEPLGVPEKTSLMGYSGGSEVRVRALIRSQLLWLVDSVYRVEPTFNKTKFSEGDGSEERWNRIVGEFSKLRIRWDPSHQRYAFQDGTALADEPAPYYRREIWKTLPPGTGAVLVLERGDPKHVNITLTWTERAGIPAGPAVLRVFPREDRTRTLAEFRIEGEGRFRTVSSSVTIALSSDSEIQAELVHKETETSPVYKP